MLSYLRRHLGLKLFISYLGVILMGVVVLATTAELVVPNTFERHMADMGPMMSVMMGGSIQDFDENLFVNFRAAVSEAIGLAALAATATAIIASLLISRQVVAPVQAMMAASRRIAEGHYEERVRVTGDIPKQEQDELGQLALSFNQMANQLERTEAIRRQLIGDVAHELRTPLTTIKGYTEGLMDGLLPANAETYTQIYREADRLQRLVNDLQELSRVEAGAYELHRKTTTVKALVDATIERIESQFQEKGVQLTTQIHPGLPDIQVDEDRIGQVLLNLVGNALQHTPPGGTVLIKAIKQPGQVQIEITDTGTGVPVEHLPHLFTRFYRVDKSRSRQAGGSGIGLTIAKHLVEAHGGRIWAESSGTGKGATFGFTLPVSRKDL
jgi:signal transduction histidine kinase